MLATVPLYVLPTRETHWVPGAWDVKRPGTNLPGGMTQQQRFLIGRLHQWKLSKIIVTRRFQILRVFFWNDPGVSKKISILTLLLAHLLVTLTFELHVWAHQVIIVYSETTTNNFN